MFIAFEGPDNTGKSTSAARLGTEAPLYNVTKHRHSWNTPLDDSGMVQTYDRIDWLTHMVYRLALPAADWNDDRPRTVFAMPDTHLVFKLHRPDTADFIADEAVHTPIVEVNAMYRYFADYFMALNRARDYALFKTVSIMEVVNTEGQPFSQRLIAFDSPTYGWSNGMLPLHRLVDSDSSLLTFLQDADRQIT